MAEHKGKMHQLLAVESPIQANYSRDMLETLGVFKKSELFTASTTKKTHFDENDSRLDTIETTAMTTTVKDRLVWFSKAVVPFLDVQLQKDLTNQTARADLVVEGKTIAKAVPAVTLLMLENKLGDIRKVFEAAPTLQPGVEWVRDSSKHNVFKAASPETKFTTRKNIRPIVLYAHTDKHPAQIEKVSEDLPVARVERFVESGMMTSADKADLLGRLDTLLKAVKQARQVANDVEASTEKIGKSLFDFLYEGIVTRTGGAAA